MYTRYYRFFFWVGGEGGFLIEEGNSFKRVLFSPHHRVFLGGLLFIYYFYCFFFWFNHNHTVLLKKINSFLLSFQNVISKLPTVKPQLHRKTSIKNEILFDINNYK